LGSEIGEAHPFSSIGSGLTSEEYEAKYGNMTTFYERDRGETDQGFKTFDNFVSLAEYCEAAGCEFIYMYSDGEWYVSKYKFTGVNNLKYELEQLKVPA
jgi:hypothetical protein